MKKQKKDKEKCWIEKQYPVGSKIIAEHPDKEREEIARVISHTIGKAFGGGQRCEGIWVEFSDGRRIEIEAMFLEE